MNTRNNTEESDYIIAIGYGRNEYDAICELKSKVDELKKCGYITLGQARVSKNEKGWYMVFQGMEMENKKLEYDKIIGERYREQIRKRFERKW